MIPQRLIYKKNKLLILDQRLLPEKISYYTARNVKEVHKAIKDMVLRGAPLIGDTAALGYVMAINEIKTQKTEEIIKELKKTADFLKTARPTAVSLFKAVDRMYSKTLEILKSKNCSIKKLKHELEKEAFKILKEDSDSTYQIAKYGISLLKKNSRIITYCNTGALATYGVGTALGIITEGFKKGRVSYVYSCETRPYLQGARLTAWELYRNKIPSALICDNMAGWIMKTEKIDAVIIGADRIAANGDTANKIGSYSLAILAKYHNIPYYVAAPTDTFDTNIKNGSHIKIEERSVEEVIKVKGNYIAPKNIKARHPAFDVVPNNLITAIITEKGIIKKPNSKKIFQHLH